MRIGIRANGHKPIRARPCEVSQELSRFRSKLRMAPAVDAATFVSVLALKSRPFPHRPRVLVSLSWLSLIRISIPASRVMGITTNTPPLISKRSWALPISSLTATTETRRPPIPSTAPTTSMESSDLRAAPIRAVLIMVPI